MKDNFEKDEKIRSSFDKVRSERPSHSVMDKANDFAAAHPKRLKGRTMSLLLNYGVAFLVVAIILPVVFVFASPMTAKGTFLEVANKSGDMALVPASDNAAYMRSEVGENHLENQSLCDYDVHTVIMDDVINADSGIIYDEYGSVDEPMNYSLNGSDEKKALTEWYYDEVVIKTRKIISKLMGYMNSSLNDFSFLVSENTIIAALGSDKNKTLFIVGLLGSEISEKLLKDVTDGDPTEYSLELGTETCPISIDYYACSEETEAKTWLTSAFVSGNNSEFYIEYSSNGKPAAESLFGTTAEYEKQN